MSVGYPKNAKTLSESERIDRFVEAFALVRNTTWARIVRETFRNLWGIELSDAAGLRRADEAVRSTGGDSGWPRTVIDKLNIKRIVTNIEHEAEYPDLPGVGSAVPIWDGYETWVERLTKARDTKAAGQEAIEAIERDVAGITARGYRGMRVHVHTFDGGAQEQNLAAVLHGDRLPPYGVGEAESHAFLAHAILRALSTHEGMFAQLFLGIHPFLDMASEWVSVRRIRCRACIPCFASIAATLNSSPALHA